MLEVKPTGLLGDNMPRVSKTQKLDDKLISSHLELMFIFIFAFAYFRVFMYIFLPVFYLTMSISVQIHE